MMFKVRVRALSVASLYEASPLDYPAVNPHVLIAGSSGSGKSFLASKLFPSPDGILLFKPDHIFPDVPFASSSLIGLPSPFSFSPSDIADAYFYASGIGSVGIMASSLVPMVLRAFTGAKNWRGFEVNLFNFPKDFLLTSLANMVYNDFALFYGFLDDPVNWGVDYSDPKTFSTLSDFVNSTHRLPLLSGSDLTNSLSVPDLSVPAVRSSPAGRISSDPLLSDAVIRSRRSLHKISFAGLPTRTSEFGAELFLRGLYSHLDGSFGRLLIDEFHHVGRAGSITDTLLREFRISGSLVAITQSMSDLSPAMLNNFGYILISRSLNYKDLQFLDTLKSGLSSLVSSLPPRVFLNLSEYLTSYSGSLPLYSWVD